ncbi:MAG: acyl-CoA dehydrogenase family protein [Acidimicrobiia bacterium]
MFEVDERYHAVRAEAEAVAAAIAPYSIEADEANDVHPKVAEIVRESRLSEFMVPAAHGGRFSAVDPVAVTIVREVLMHECSHADSLFALQGIGSYALSVAGSEEQRTEWLPRVARMEALAAIALTEPNAGSDLKTIETAAFADGDEVVLNGDKAYISNGAAATFFTTFAREGDGYSVFLVPANTPGVSVTPVPELIAPHVLGDVHYRDVRLPASARIGDSGQGLQHVLATLTVFRISVAGAAVGLAEAALEAAVAHTTTRVQFGRPLAKLGPVAQMLADAWSELEAAKLLTYRAAERARDGYPGTLEHSSMAKLYATEACGRIVDRCVQVMGRWGLEHNSRIERCYRQARPMRIYEGSSEVLRLGVAKRLTEEMQ